MPKYKVLSASDDVIPVANLLVTDEEGRITHILVKGMTGENAKLLVGEEIRVHTTNREIIPRDIIVKSFETESEVPDFDDLVEE
jgi:hypothetical protein